MKGDRGLPAEGEEPPRICDNHDVRLIKVHHIRHTVASILKDPHVPARDA
jgi:hypothetical protein